MRDTMLATSAGSLFLIAAGTFVACAMIGMIFTHMYQKIRPESPISVDVRNLFILLAIDTAISLDVGYVYDWGFAVAIGVGLVSCSIAGYLSIR